MMKLQLVTLAAALPLAVLGAPHPSMLVSGDWLAQHLKDPALVVLHVGSQQDYAAGHIAGARLVTLGDISITNQRGLRLELPPVSELEQAFGRLGISDSSRIVVYPGTDSVQSATRVWFTLDYLGLGDHAALLDGGLASWRAEGRPLSTEASVAAPQKFTAHTAPQLVVDADWVREHLRDPAVQILDARLPDYYSGSNAGGMPRAGHIPGARNVPYTTVFAAGGKLDTPDRLSAMLNQAASKEPAITVSYCHIGQQATVLYFAARYLGLDARLYDGSFQDWSGRPDVPVEGVAGKSQDDAALASKISAIFSFADTENSPGLAILVREHGRTVFERGYGVRSLRAPSKIDSHTDFRLASVTKQFTAMAAMLLIHDGKLRYDQKLTDIFPDFPAYGQAITLRRLLTHTSGLPDYEDLMEATAKNGGPTWTSAHQIQDREVLELLKHQTAGKFAPGAEWSYSNSGYVLLGLVVEKVSGKPFGQFLRDRIFEPLHMNTTLVYVNGENQVPERAFGHGKEAGGLIETDQSSTSATRGDGGVYSNLDDLARWDDALEKHLLLSEAEMNAALTPVQLSNGKTAPYGFGWFLDPYAEHARMWHSGSTRGFGTVIDRFTAEKLTIVILCNRTDLNPAKLALQTADVLFERR